MSPVTAPFGIENRATLALAVKLTAYFNGVIHLELVDAANGLTNFLGTSYNMSILVAILADTYIGRYKAGGCLEFVVCLQILHPTSSSNDIVILIAIFDN